MAETAPVFAQIIEDYLSKVNGLDDLARRCEALGAACTSEGIRVPLFNRRITIGAGGNIVDDRNNTVSHAVGVLVAQYLLLCPDPLPDEGELCTYKDFKDAGPYVGGFAATTEQAIAKFFSRRLELLESACRTLGGTPFETDVSCDLAFRFEALPRVPLVLLFHDADDDFGAQATVLFRRDAAAYLDMECLAMVGGILAVWLQAAGVC